jgi:dTDP-4-amino-4,6-dideoxygalactose transaminase
MGIETREFENELTEFFRTPNTAPHVICVNSCTAALHLSLQALGITYGDEVLVPSLTFIASFQAISATGAIPIPVDSDLDDGFISIDDIVKQQRVTGRTKAIMPVLYAGCGGRKMHKIYEFAKENNLYVVEDAAHCFGEENIAQRAGILCFSFDAIKNITCGDGGCIITSDYKIADKIKDIRLLGVIGDTEARYSGKRSWGSDTVDQGWRYHMSNISAAIGRAQLSRFNTDLGLKRKKYANMYINELQNLENIRLFPINAKTAVPHIFPIIVKNGKRNDLKNFLRDYDIESGVQYKPNHLLTKFNRGYDLPNVMSIYESILSIPLHPRLSETDVLYIIGKIRKFFK